MKFDEAAPLRIHTMFTAHMFVFSAILATAVYMTFDVEFSRAGFDSTEQIAADRLRAGMKSLAR
jgi:hypothetical protein